MKDGLHGEHFTSNDIIMTAVNQWVFSTGADFYKCSMQALIHRWQKCIDNGDDYAVFCSREFALLNRVIMLFVSIIMSLVINRRHYLQSDIYS